VSGISCRDNRAVTEKNKEHQTHKRTRSGSAARTTENKFPSRIMREGETAVQGGNPQKSYGSCSGGKNQHGTNGSKKECLCGKGKTKKSAPVWAQKRKN